MKAAQSLTEEEVAEFAEARKSVAGAGTQIAGSSEVRTYDFAKPDKLSKTHLRVAQMMLSSLEKSWSSTLTTMLKTETVVNLNAVEQATMGAHGESLPSEVLLASLRVGNLPGVSFIDMPGTLAMSMVDRMTGGSGKSPTTSRSLSTLELMVIKKMFDGLAADLAAAMRPVTQLNISVSDYRDSLDDLGMNPSDVVLVAGFTLTTPLEKNNVDLVIPGSSLDSIRDLLTPERFMTGKRASEAVDPSSTAKLLNSVTMKAAVELGRTSVSMREVIEMGVGDVITLDKLADDQLDVYVQGKMKFHARPGLSGNRVAVQITEMARDLDDETAGIVIELPGEETMSGGQVN